MQKKNQNLITKLTTGSEQTEPEPKKESHSDIILRLGNDTAEFFKDENDEAYATIQFNGRTETCKVLSRKFRLHLINEFHQETGRAPAEDAVRQAMNVMESLAAIKGETVEINMRVAKGKKVFYYDLADDQGRAVKITKKGCKIVNNIPVVFGRNRSVKQQVEPDFEGDIKLILNHIPLKKFKRKDKQQGERVFSDDEVLLMVYLVTCFVPDIPHPVLVLCGEKGAAKSTTLRMIREIVDPSLCDLLVMPNSQQDLVVILSNHYMPCFDNMETISAEKSNLLCVACTGGSVSKRKLFTNDDEHIANFKRCVGINGINVVITKSDLLDRSILINLNRISEKRRKEESEVWDTFNQDKASILGGTFRALSKAIAIYPTVELEKNQEWRISQGGVLQ